MNKSPLSPYGLLGLIAVPVLIGCAVAAGNFAGATPNPAHLGPMPKKSANGLYLVKDAPNPLPAKTELARFAGGCFWGVEDYFRHEPGVIATAVGFSGGHVKNPSYERVCQGDTGHAESVEVEFDPTKTSYRKLCQLFFDIHNPTELDRQGPDVGYQYRSIVFYRTPEQEAIAKDTIRQLEATDDFKGEKIVTEVIPAGPFYFAEDYHQQYIEQGGRAYCHARTDHKYGGK